MGAPPKWPAAVRLAAALGFLGLAAMDRVVAGVLDVGLRPPLRFLRQYVLQLGFLEWAEGSVLMEMGKTRVLAAASYEARVPRFLVGSGKGWVSAEYSMLPRATEVRTPRPASTLRCMCQCGPSGPHFKSEKTFSQSRH